MKRYARPFTLVFACILSLHGCRSGDETAKGDAKEKVQEAVRDVVTKDFKLYDSAKETLAESERKSKAQLDMIDKELK